MRQVLVDYANALTILDWQAETAAKRKRHAEEPDDPENSDEAVARRQAERAAGKADADAQLAACFAEYRLLQSTPSLVRVEKK